MSSAGSAAGGSKPVLLISMFNQAGLAQIGARLKRVPPPAGVPIFIGSFGISGVQEALIKDIPQANYAPMFSVQPDTSRDVHRRRAVSKEEAQSLDDTFAGPIPKDPRNPVLPPSRHREWGIELGQRFRDQLRRQRADGADIPAGSWQLDEILGQCAGAREPNRFRQFIGGVLHGIAFGRPELLDPHERGFVWSAFTALKSLPTLTITPALQQFWQDLDAAAGHLIGEEYPRFDQSPNSRSRTYSQPHRQLAISAGQIRKGLANRYIVGMTPGFRPSDGLGGNVLGLPLSGVTDWRNRFIGARIAAQKPSGYAQFSLVKENAQQAHLADALDSLNHAASHHNAV
jgi:hypothetical protein